LASYALMGIANGYNFLLNWARLNAAFSGAFDPV